MRIEMVDLHGTGAEPREVYEMPPRPRLDPEGRPVGWDFWGAVTSYRDHAVACPVEGCEGVVVWFEAGYVPGYRACGRLDGRGVLDPGSLRHRFLARGSPEQPALVRDRCCER